jgi:pimeloyl-ACP methyl ester carboxylesterase
VQIDVPGGHIHAVVEGDGPLVLLVHGFSEGAWALRHQLPALAAAGYLAVVNTLLLDFLEGLTA